MNTDIQILKHENLLGKSFTIYGDLENPLFLARDVAEWIEHSDVSTMIRLVDECEKLRQTLFVSGQNREVILLTEDGVYEILMQSNKPIAKQFKKGVKIILSAIRKTGGYIVSNPGETSEELLSRALIVAQATIDRQKQRTQILEGENEHLTAEVRHLAPKAEYTDKVLQSTSTYTMTQVAKECGMSAVALEKRLREKGVMFRQSGQWILYAKYQGKGYTQSRTHHYIHSDGTAGTNTITVWTERGRAFIHQLFDEKINKSEISGNKVKAGRIVRASEYIT
jgi:phage antirepressor YoqD-like protein